MKKLDYAKGGLGSAVPGCDTCVTAQSTSASSIPSHSNVIPEVVAVLWLAGQRAHWKRKGHGMLSFPVEHQNVCQNRLSPAVTVGGHSKSGSFFVVPNNSNRNWTWFREVNLQMTKEVTGFLSSDCLSQLCHLCLPSLHCLPSLPSASGKYQNVWGICSKPARRTRRKLDATRKGPRKGPRRSGFGIGFLSFFFSFVVSVFT